MALAQSEQTSDACRLRVEATIAELVDCCAQLKATQVELATWQASALNTTEVIESLKNSIFTLKTEAACVSAQRADRLVLADQMIASLNTDIYERDREIDQLTHRLAGSGLANVYIRGCDGISRQLMEATVALCTGGDHALRVARRTMKDQRRIIAGQRNMLRLHHIPWPLEPNLATAAVAGIDASGLKPHELDPNSRLC